MKTTLRSRMVQNNYGGGVMETIGTTLRRIWRFELQRNVFHLTIKKSLAKFRSKCIEIIMFS